MLAVVLRYRRGGPVERVQLQWLIAVAAVAAVAFPVAFLCPRCSSPTVAFLVGAARPVALPIVIGIAILRYRLYEIDRIISRTALVGGRHRRACSWSSSRLVSRRSAALDGVTQGQMPRRGRARRSSPLALFQPAPPARPARRRPALRPRPATTPIGRPTPFAERLRDEVDLRRRAAEPDWHLVEGSLRPVDHDPVAARREEAR